MARLPWRRRPEPEQEDLDFRVLAEEPDPVRRDEGVVAALRDAGADLGRGRETIVYLSFPSEEAARGAARELGVKGFDVKIAPPDEQVREWSVRGTQWLIVHEASIAIMRGRMTAIAAAHGGEYDGWEAAAD